jgi:hypothetical protein
MQMPYKLQSGPRALRREDESVFRVTGHSRALTKGIRVFSSPFPLCREPTLAHTADHFVLGPCTAASQMTLYIIECAGLT